MSERLSATGDWNAEYARTPTTKGSSMNTTGYGYAEKDAAQAADIGRQRVSGAIIGGSTLTQATETPISKATQLVRDAIGRVGQVGAQIFELNGRAFGHFPNGESCAEKAALPSGSIGELFDVIDSLHLAITDLEASAQRACTIA